MPQSARITHSPLFQTLVEMRARAMVVQAAWKLSRATGPDAVNAVLGSVMGATALCAVAGLRSLFLECTVLAASMLLKCGKPRAARVHLEPAVPAIMEGAPLVVRAGACVTLAKCSIAECSGFGVSHCVGNADLALLATAQRWLRVAHAAVAELGDVQSSMEVLFLQV